MIDKFYFIKGGAERYAFELTKILEAQGHEVIPFSMKHASNFDTPYSGYFVDEIDFNPRGLGDQIRTGLRSAGRVIWSREAQKKIRRLIRDTRPDIAHCHMIDHQISPSILPELKSAGIPVIQTIHTYKPVCPSYRLYLMDRGTICEKCLSGQYVHALRQKCHKGSLAASGILALEMYVHKWLRLYERHIDLYHVPSQFMGDKLAEGGIDPKRIRHLFYTIDLNAYPPGKTEGDYAVCYGRLSEEKGILTLLKAMARTSGLRLKLVGDGPQRPKLEAFVQEQGLETVEFTGILEGEALKGIVAAARFVIVPSEWYDNSPLVIYESLAMGKPVIGSRMGGIPELIRHGEDGYLFDAGDDRKLALLMQDLNDHPEKRKKMGKAGHEKAKILFGPATHYQHIMKWYTDLTGRRPDRAGRSGR